MRIVTTTSKIKVKSEVGENNTFCIIKLIPPAPPFSFKINTVHKELYPDGEVLLLVETEQGSNTISLYPDSDQEKAILSNRMFVSIENDGYVLLLFLNSSTVQTFEAVLDDTPSLTQHPKEITSVSDIGLSDKVQEELSLTELLILVGNLPCPDYDHPSTSIGTSIVITLNNLKDMEEKINARSDTPVEGWLTASEVIGTGAKGYVSPDYKVKVQDYVRSLGLSIYKS